MLLFARRPLTFADVGRRDSSVDLSQVAKGQVVGVVAARDAEPVPFYGVDVNDLLITLNGRLSRPIVRGFPLAHYFKPLRTQLSLAHCVADHFV